MTSSSKPLDLAALDSLTGGAFQAVTSGERSARLREWLLSEPAADVLAEVYREMSTRDKGAAKLLKEKLDELKRVHGQEALASDWAQKAEQMLQAPRLNIADAMAWQRDAAKAGAPLSREPLASLKVRLAEVVKGVEDLQHQVMVQREAAVLLAQRIEVLSTKPIAEAQAALAGLQTDVAQWQSQAQQLTTNAVWPSVDMKFPSQLDAALNQLQAVWDGFSAALTLAQQAQVDATAALPSVPVWADEIRRLRGEAVAEVLTAASGAAATEAAKEAAKEAKPAKPKMDAAQRQALREQANKAVTEVLEALEKQITEPPVPADAAVALRAALKTHGKNLDTALDERVHKALTATGDAEGWQRWLADQVRQDLVNQAEALLDAEKAPTMGGRKMQDKLRQLRESWKQTDQGGLPNHALWKRFDAACNEAYKAVLAWLEQMKKDSAEHRAQRMALLEEVKAWTTANAESDDWRAQLRALHQFADRWRNAGHLNEKTFGEMQSQWKAVLKAAAARLEAAQKASVERRQALINEAREVGAAPALRVDAVKALQQRWQVEAQSVPLDRKTEQKLWEVFRAPLDEAFQRKGTERHASAAPLTARDRAVIDASKALDEANAAGDAGKIRAAMAALDAALRGQAQEAQAVQVASTPAAVPVSAPESAPAVSAASEAPAEEAAPVAETDAAAEAPADAAAATAESVESAEAAPAEAPAAPVAPPKPAKPVVAVRGDDRPGQKKTEAASGRDGRDGRRDGRPGERGARPGGDRGPGRPGERGGDRFGDRGGRGEGRDFREDRGPRLGDAAFRAQREAMERAEMSLRKLAAQAHGETLTRVMGAWQERQADALPSAQELGRAINAATRQAWAQAVSTPAKTPAATALLRLEMAAEVPTPADSLSERRMLQLQLLTQRNQPGPRETWGQDVAQVLSGPHEEATARRLQNVLKNLLRG